MTKNNLRLFALSLVPFGMLGISPNIWAAGFGFGKSLRFELSDRSTSNETSLDLTVLPADDHSTRLRSSSLNPSAASFLHDRGLNPILDIRPRKDRTRSNGRGLMSGANALFLDYEYTIQDIPVCNTSVRIVEQADGQRLVVGSIPLIDDNYVSYTSEDWGDPAEISTEAAVKVVNFLGLLAGPTKVLDTKKCLTKQNGLLVPAWEVVVAINDTQYQITASANTIHSAYKRSFNAATANVEVYSPNIKSGRLTKHAVPVTGNGTLTNRYFTTENYNGAPRAYSANNSFPFTGKSSEAAEAHVFVYANQQLDFFQSFGVGKTPSKPLPLSVHALPDGQTNNAGYYPSAGGTGPYILIGEGDGKNFQNLAYDADVVSHEFAHHIIFESIYSDRHEAKVLHEGLADFFSMSRSGSPCLAASVCPTGSKSSTCAINANLCLRTAENDLKYSSETYRSQSYAKDLHLQSIVISGFLWDLRSQDLIPADTLTAYALEALTYVPANASIKNFMAAIFYVDSLHNSSYANALQDTASARGLGAEALGIDLADLPPSVGNPSQNEFNATKITGLISHELTRKISSGCAVLGVENHRAASKLWLIGLFCIPLLTFAKRKSAI